MEAVVNCLRCMKSMFSFHQSHDLDERFIFDMIKLSDLLLERSPVFDHRFSSLEFEFALGGTVFNLWEGCKVVAQERIYRIGDFIFESRNWCFAFSARSK